MATKKPRPEAEADAKKPRNTRDYSQRAHDAVREAEKRHAGRHEDE